MFKFVFGIIIGIVAVVFALQNTADVDVKFLVWTLTVSRALILLVMLAAGFLVGLAVGGLARRRRRK
jgi:putative membrane protein